MLDSSLFHLSCLGYLGCFYFHRNGKPGPFGFLLGLQLIHNLVGIDILTPLNFKYTNMIYFSIYIFFNFVHQCSIIYFPFLHLFSLNSLPPFLLFFRIGDETKCLVYAKHIFYHEDTPIPEFYFQNESTPHKSNPHFFLEKEKSKV